MFIIDGWWWEVEGGGWWVAGGGVVGGGVVGGGGREPTGTQPTGTQRSKSSPGDKIWWLFVNLDNQLFMNQHISNFAPFLGSRFGWFGIGFGSILAPCLIDFAQLLHHLFELWFCIYCWMVFHSFSGRWTIIDNRHFLKIRLLVNASILHPF